MRYNRKAHRSISFFIMLFVYLMTIIVAKNYVFDNALNNPFQKVLAHVSNKYGNITIQTGWDPEPPLVDEINDIVVGVTRESDLGNSNSTTPVRNALADMNIMVKYGGMTKALDFVPSQEQEGWYEAKILPTRIGSYSLVLNGTIQNQPISDEVQVEDVESTQKVSFPEVSSGSSDSSNGATGTNLLTGQISNILNQITNDINNIRDDIGTLAESNSNIQEGIQDVKDIADRSYMLALTAIGVGAAGILIAAAALVRIR
jgi:methyl-accepting chemotaxis protein